MRTQLLKCFGFVSGLMITGSAHAGPADGRYTSNKGNELYVSGGSYTYKGVSGGPSTASGSVS